MLRIGAEPGGVVEQVAAASGLDPEGNQPSFQGQPKVSSFQSRFHSALYSLAHARLNEAFDCTSSHVTYKPA